MGFYLGWIFAPFSCCPVGESGESICRMWGRCRGAKIIWISFLPCQVWWGWYFEHCLEGKKKFCFFTSNMHKAQCQYIGYLRDNFEVFDALIALIWVKIDMKEGRLLQAAKFYPILQGWGRGNCNTFRLGRRCCNSPQWYYLHPSL